MKLLKLIAHKGKYSLVQDDHKRIVEVKLDGNDVTRFTLEELLRVTFSGWTSMAPMVIHEMMKLEVVNENRKLRGHQTYALNTLNDI